MASLAGVPKPPVWVDSTAVGSATVCTPSVESTGTMTDSAARPKPGRSWMANTVLGALDMVRFLLFVRVCSFFNTAILP